MRQSVLATCFCVLSIAPLGVAANLSGRVVDEGGGWLAKVAVVWWAVPDTGRSGPMAVSALPDVSITKRGSIVSDGDGRFDLGDLPSGNYRVCVTSLADPAHLSTCEWRGREIAVSMTSAARSLDIGVQKGAVLRFHIRDQKNRLTSDNVSIIVSAANQGFAHARVLSVTPSQAELFVAVPFDTTVAAVIKAPAPVRDGGGSVVQLGVPSLVMSIGKNVDREIYLTVE